MNTEGLTILSYRGGRSKYSAFDFFVIGDTVTTGYLYETYDNNGFPITHEDAGDYCFANSMSDCENDCINKMKEAFPSVDGEISIDFSGAVEVDGEENEELTKWARGWELENARYTKCDYINVWDGSNWNTLIVRCDDISDAAEWEVASDEEAKPILEALAKYDLHIENGAEKCEVIDGYEISHSIWAGDFWIARVNEIWG